MTTKEQAQAALDAWEKYCAEASYDEHYNDLQFYGAEIRKALLAQYNAGKKEMGE